MPKALVSTSAVRCSFGSMPTPFISPPLPGKPTVNGLPVGLITDTLVTNIPSFTMCNAPLNPAVIAATAAAMGAPTPAPCLPVLSPWAPGSVTTKFGFLSVATVACKALCAWAGVVSVDISANPIVDV